MRVSLIITCLVIGLLSSCRNSAKYIYNEGYIYGTVYHIIYESPQGTDLSGEIKELLQEYTKTFSTYDSTSIISKINSNKPVELNSYFINCFNRSMEISEMTGGAFDITTGPLVNAWGFGPEERKKMTPEIVDSLKALTGYRKIRLENGKIIKEDPDMKLDMSAVAKGYTCDLIAEFLKNKECENYMVEIGGEVVAKGKNEKGSIWTIGISKPDDLAFFISTDLQAKVHLPGNALATSGNYRNYYIDEGRKYAHTIDPQTGYPVQHSLLSATVLAGNCMDADALATSFMVMGIDKSIELSRKLTDVEVYFIYSGDNGENSIYMSDNFKELLVE